MDESGGCGGGRPSAPGSTRAASVRSTVRAKNGSAHSRARCGTKGSGGAGPARTRAYAFPVIADMDFGHTSP